MPGSKLNADGNNQGDALGDWADAVLQASGINPNEATPEQTDGLPQDHTGREAVKHLQGELTSFEQKVQTAKAQWSPTCKLINAPEFTIAYENACAAIHTARETEKSSDLDTDRQYALMQEKLFEAQDHYDAMQKQYDAARDFLSELIEPAKEQAIEISASLAELVGRRSEIERPGLDLSSFDSACQQAEELSERLHQARAETDALKVAKSLSALKMAFAAAKKAFTRGGHRSPDTVAEPKAPENKDLRELEQIQAEASKFNAPVLAMKQRRLKIKSSDVDLNGYTQAMTMFERMRSALNTAIDEEDIPQAEAFLQLMKSMFRTLRDRFDKLLEALQKAKAEEPEGTEEELVRIQEEALRLSEKAMALSEGSDDFGGIDTSRFSFQNSIEMFEHAHTMLKSAIRERDTGEASYYLSCMSTTYIAAQTEVEKLNQKQSETKAGQQDVGEEDAGNSSELFKVTTEAKELYNKINSELRILKQRHNESDQAGLDHTLLKETVSALKDAHAHLNQEAADQNISEALVALKKMYMLNDIVQKEFDRLHQTLARVETGQDNTSLED